MDITAFCRTFSPVMHGVMFQAGLFCPWQWKV